MAALSTFLTNRDEGKILVIQGDGGRCLWHGSRLTLLSYNVIVTVNAKPTKSLIYFEL